MTNPITSVPPASYPLLDGEDPEICAILSQANKKTTNAAAAVLDSGKGAPPAAPQLKGRMGPAVDDLSPQMMLPPPSMVTIGNTTFSLIHP